MPEILKDIGEAFLFVGAVALFGWMRWQQMKKSARDLGGKKDPCC